MTLWRKCSTMQSTKDDDILDFLLSHHTFSERKGRCFSFRGRYICARCSGWAIGLVLPLIFPLLLGYDYYYLLPVPAFLDWIVRKRGIFDSGKYGGLITGMILGISQPTYFLELIEIEPLAIISALLYFAVFIIVQFISIKGNRKGPSA